MPVLPTVVALLILLVLLRALSFIVTLLAADVAHALLEFGKVIALLLNGCLERFDQLQTRSVW